MLGFELFTPGILFLISFENKYDESKMPNISKHGQKALYRIKLFVRVRGDGWDGGNSEKCLKLGVGGHQGISPKKRLKGVF